MGKQIESRFLYGKKLFQDIAECKPDVVDQDRKMFACAVREPKFSDPPSLWLLIVPDGNDCTDAFCTVYGSQTIARLNAGWKGWYLEEMSSDLVEFWFSFGSFWVQAWVRWFKSGSVLVQFWFSSGSGLGQVATRSICTVALLEQGLRHLEGNRPYVAGPFRLSS